MRILRREAEPTRFRDGGDAVDARIGRLLGGVAPPPPLPPARLDRLVGRVFLRGGGARARGRWFTLLAGVLLGVSGAVFARPLGTMAQQLWQRAWQRPAAAPVSAPATPEPVTLPAPAIEVVVAPAIETARARHHDGAGAANLPAREAIRGGPREGKPGRLAVRDPAPARRSRARTESVELAPPDGTNIAAVIGSRRGGGPAPGRGAFPQLGEETALIRRALASLRHDDDAAGALDTLDEYERRFPFGALRPTATLVRIDASLAVGRRAQALALLERLDLGGTPRTGELLVTRGELRAARDCTAARDDFTQALAHTREPALRARGLAGRAICADRMGDADSAHDDLEAYLREFPRGPFAKEARARLAR